MSLSKIQYAEIDRTGIVVDSNESRAPRLFPKLVWKTDLKHEISQVINERIMVRLARITALGQSGQRLRCAEPSCLATMDTLNRARRDNLND